MALPESCPLCASKTADQSVVTSHVYGASDAERAFFHCSICDVRYMHPGLTPQEETRFYAAESKASWPNVPEPRVDGAMSRITFAPMSPPGCAACVTSNRIWARAPACWKWAALPDSCFSH